MVLMAPGRAGSKESSAFADQFIIADFVRLSTTFFEFFGAIYPEFPKGCIYLDTPYKACHPERRAKPEVEGSSHRFHRKCSAGAKILRLASLAQDDTLRGTVSHRPTGQKIPRFRRNGGFPWFRSCRKITFIYNRSQTPRTMGCLPPQYEQFSRRASRLSAGRGRSRRRRPASRPQQQ